MRTVHRAIACKNRISTVSWVRCRHCSNRIRTDNNWEPCYRLCDQTQWLQCRINLTSRKVLQERHTDCPVFQTRHDTCNTHTINLKETISPDAENTHYKVLTPTTISFLGSYTGRPL